jgi:transketolase
MKQAFIETLEQLMTENKNIVTMTADMGYSVFESIQKKFPKRFFNTGITEQSSTSVAAGLALMGHEVYFYAQAPFITMRNFEQVRLDLAYNNLNVKLIGTNAGVSLNQLGVSHFAVEDVAIMRLLPNFTVFTPGSPKEMSQCMQKAHSIKGPTYLRFTKSGSEEIKGLPITDGTDGVLFVSGGLLKTAYEIVTELKKKNIHLSLYSVPVVSPFNRKQFIKQAQNLPLFTIEEHSVIGGLGTIISEAVVDLRLQNTVTKFGLEHKFIHVTGSIDYLLKTNGIDPKKIALRIMKQMKK